MDSFEINKIIASILLVALLIIGISKVSNIIFVVEKPERSAYKVEIVGSEQAMIENEVKSETEIIKESGWIREISIVQDSIFNEEITNIFIHY